MMLRAPKIHSLVLPLAGITLALAATACGGAVGSGVAIGKVGRGLSARADAVPQGSEVCALQDAIAAPGPSEKPSSEVCKKTAKNDVLWRKSIIVLGAYGATLESVAGGSSGDQAGNVEAAGTGVQVGAWVEVDGAPEQAARDAVNTLITQLSASGSKDLGRMIKDAAPHVKTICDGLTPYLEAQRKGFETVQKDAEKKRTTHTDRRCGSVDTRSVCVSESVIDRMVYAEVYGRAASLEASHAEARDAVAGFCAAHKKVEDAAANGDLGKDKTVTDVVEALKSVRAAPPPADAKPAKGAPKK
jgi:hypothetical protein